jgi:quercetin dioxygenase-like cupin family protein
MCGWRGAGDGVRIVRVGRAARARRNGRTPPKPREHTMKRSWSTIATVSSAAATLVLLAAFQAQQRSTAPAALPIAGKLLVAPGDLKWSALPGIPGAEQAALVGDPAKEAHRAFFRYPVGLKSPPHSHTWGDRGVVVSGMLSLAVDGAAPKRLGPGSFFSIAAGIPHVTTVEGDVPCVFFMEREGPFDVVVAEDSGKH